MRDARFQELDALIGKETPIGRIDRELTRKAIARTEKAVVQSRVPSLRHQREMMGRMRQKAPYAKYECFSVNRRKVLYECGYEPDDKTLKQVVKHWKQCDSEQCKRSLANHQATKAYFRAKFLVN